MIKIETIYASNDHDLSKELSKIDGRIINVEYQHDDLYKVIYDEKL